MYFENIWKAVVLQNIFIRTENKENSLLKAVNSHLANKYLIKLFLISSRCIN